MSYFKVGEECILQSKCYPELNGVCVITEVLSDECRNVYSSNGKFEFRGGHAYFTTIKSNTGRAWDESALRKKHKPSTESLSTMIEELNKVKV
jgi:hypothetical protein